MCGYTCIRYLVFFFNVIFFITGAGLVGAGAYLKVEKDDYLDLCDDYSWATAANLLLAAGVIILVIAFFGCYGAWKQSTCLLGIFFVFLLIIFLMELAAGIYAAVEKNKVEDELKSCLNGTFKNVQGDKDLRKKWSEFEDKYDCCGIDGGSDYTGSYKAPCTNESYKNDGCYDKIKTDLEDNLTIVIGVGIAFAVIQILGMVMSLWMICQIKSGGDMA
ncbi:leukocyte surface antigen CD53-like [Dendronephthya gigantea]|uniref:leukocyte surface antigen CD53-like n=1 Tax=Dendronephthya gigantea TaxID=151771 RepID=UPI00106BF7F5|nr:leukocyte surface antigen CD53-like [Dendronephthya gigantea]